MAAVYIGVRLPVPFTVGSAPERRNPLPLLTTPRELPRDRARPALPPLPLTALSSSELLARFPTASCPALTPSDLEEIPPAREDSSPGCLSRNWGVPARGGREEGTEEAMLDGCCSCGDAGLRESPEA